MREDRLEQPTGDAKLLGLALVAMLQRFGPQTFSAEQMHSLVDGEVLSYCVDKHGTLSLSLLRRVNPS